MGFPYVEMESAACPLCGCSEFVERLKAPNRFKPDDGYVFRIVECDECRLLRLEPRPTPESISHFYLDGGYQPFLSTQTRRTWSDLVYEWVRSHALRGKRKKIEKLKSTGSVLDVGCGTGEFLMEMRKHGWQVAGMEKDRAAAKYAIENYSLEVKTQDLYDCEFEENEFDIVTMWHVLEHVFEPKRMLNTIGRLLKADGFVLIAVPNIASPDARFYGKYWVALDSPRHLSHFTPISMERICLETGFQIVKTDQMILDAFYNCLFSEQLKAALTNSSKLLMPVRAFRAVFMACITIIGSSMLASSGVPNGSSNLYLIRKVD